MARTHKEIADIRSKARAHTDAMLKVLVGVASSKGAQAGARVAAACAILDRGWGKAPAQLTGADGGDIQIVIRQIIETATVSDDALVIEHDDSEKPATTE